MKNRRGVDVRRYNRIRFDRYLLQYRRVEPRATARRTHFLFAGKALGGLILALSSSATLAQSTAVKETEQTLQEVVVTAQHVEENLQRTPIAIDVYSSQALKDAAIISVEGLTTVAPNIEFSESEGQPVITIRGISSRDTTEIGDPAVTVDTDGFYLNRPYSLDASLYDIDRIEVLRGPQGTLNGRNSVGGAINIVTSKPTHEFAAYTSFQYGSYNDLEAQGMVNIPVSDKLQFRASVLSASHDGYRNNGAELRGDDQDNKSVRLQIAFEPLSNLKANVSTEYTTERGTGDAVELIPYQYTDTGALIHTVPSGINPYSWNVPTQPYLNLSESQTRFAVNYDIGDIELTALGGYDHTDYHHGTDQSNPNVTPSVYQWQLNQFPDTYNLEFRITSKAVGPFQWQAGAFFFEENAHLREADAAPLADGGYDDYFGFILSTKTRSEAGYAQASYQLTDIIKLTGGLRDTHDYKNESGYDGNLTADIPYEAPTFSDVSTSKLTYHAAIEAQITSSNMAYAKIDTGYKAGGFNFGAASYAPETVTAYEIGAKNRFLNDSLQLNLSVFYDDYTDQQVSSFTKLATGEPVALTLNAGASTIYGVEADIVDKIGALGTLDVSADYLHARYTNFLGSPDPSDPVAPANLLPSGNVQLAGNTPPQAPTWSLGMGFEHTWTIPGGELTGRILSKYQSSYNFSFYNFPDTRQQAYTMSDLYLTYEPSAGHWRLTAFVRNLENAVVFRDAEESQYAAAYAYQFQPPRLFGARLAYNW
jgi:iron complex outermembrane recepter protein